MRGNIYIGGPNAGDEVPESLRCQTTIRCYKNEMLPIGHRHSREVRYEVYQFETAEVEKFYLWIDSKWTATDAFQDLLDCYQKNAQLPTR